MKRRAQRIVALTLFAILVAPATTRADFTFSVQQDVSALFGASTPPGPFYLGLNLNSADSGAFNNQALVSWNFGQATGVSLDGASTVVQGTASGTMSGVLTISEGGTSMLGDYTQVLQKLSIDSPFAKIYFDVTVTENFSGPSNLYAPDMLTYQLLYDDPNNPGTLIPVVTNLAPGNIDLFQYSYQPGSAPVVGGPALGANPAPLSGIGFVFIPEPATIVVWGFALAAAGTYRWRRRTDGASRLDGCA